MADNQIFATLRGGGRIWAVAAIHGEVRRLASVHAQIARRFQPGEQVVYLGNYLGRGPHPRDTVHEILTFRRAMLARGGVDCQDFAFLRGAQEEMWNKLFTLQFAPNPGKVLEWMQGQGVDASIAAYGAHIQDGFLAAREGIVSLTRWTSGLRESFRALDGHTQLMSALRHAALTDDHQLLFVHAGLDPARPLTGQADSFWWGGPGFDALDQPYETYRLVVRGLDRRRGGVEIGPHTATLDAGCGFGGPLVAACFEPTGTICHMIEG